MFYLRKDEYFPNPGVCHLQTWCRGKKTWESELLCMDCHNFTWRSYRDPDFKLPEQYEREKWAAMVAGQPVTV